MTTIKDDLTKRLGSLLGFDEGASDVLEHLLSIESQEDLADYLSQLLGLEDTNEQVTKFVDDVGRFQRGESLSCAALPPPEESKKTLTANKQIPTTAKRTPPPKSQRSSKLQERRGKGGGKGTATKSKQQPTKKQTKHNMKDPPSTAKAVLSSSSSITTPTPKPLQPTSSPQTNNKEEETTTAHPPQESTKPEKVTPPQPPTRGKATTSCGCFGTKHKPLTNCLFCGRIICVKEGYDFCSFCGFQVEEVKVPTGESDNAAWLHKERLLKFDRDFAQRTVILDDQADYFSNKTSTWLSAEEQEDAEEKDEERRRNIHQRKHPQLNIAF
mmetsp:Transcript_7321/g.11110  ORF Transcript_7321/g.11110 Transcript_7321/m.11110 type:complete len:327 (+) Transcript_7321:109-1089(+)